MPNFNKVFLMGNLTRSPELSYLPSQTAVANFGMAVNRKWKKDGVEKEDVCFVECVAFGKSAETIRQYLDKGSAVFIEGRLSFEQWTAQDGSKRSRHKVVIEGFQFIGGRKEDTGGTPNPDWDENYKPPDDGIPF